MTEVKIEDPYNKYEVYVSKDSNIDIGYDWRGKK